jgi:hypothetical protein
LNGGREEDKKVWRAVRRGGWEGAKGEVLAALAFSGVGNPNGDPATFVDNVQVFPPGDVVPGPFGPDAPIGVVTEPHTWAAAAVLASAAAFLRWRKRAKVS